MKLYADPIQVSTAATGPDRCPSAFIWQGRDYRVVEQVDHWRIRTRWWAQEEDRAYYQVLARPLHAGPEADGLYELQQRNGRWFLGHVVD